MFITSDPKDKVYKILLDVSFSVCDQFILVVRQDINISENANAVLESLNAFLIEKREQYEWPGTKLWTGTDCFGQKQEPAIVYYFKTHDEAKSILLQESNSLHSWVGPDLPEDLSFIKNQKPWLINTSHERSSYFDTDDNNEIEKVMSIENLEVRTFNDLKNNTPKTITVSLDVECILCKDTFREGDIAPELWLVCLKCMKKDLKICKVDNIIFNKQSVNIENLIIDDIQILKIADYDLLEYITNAFLDIEKGGVCSNKCFNLSYIDECIGHLQHYLYLASRGESTSKLISLIKDNENINDIIVNKIDELKKYKLKYQ